MNYLYRYKLRLFLVNHGSLAACFRLLTGRELNKDIQYPEMPYAFQIKFLSFAPIYRLVFLACSIAALFTSGYWYCFCLLYIFRGTNVMTVVLSAVGHSSKWTHLLMYMTNNINCYCNHSYLSAGQLISLFLLMFIIIYMYSIASFIFWHDLFDIDQGQFCRTLGECVVTIFRAGLLDTLGTVSCDMWTVRVFTH